MDLSTITTSVASSLIVGIGASWLTFRLQFERFKSMDGEREKHWEKWRDQISADVESLKRSANLTEVALLKQALDALIQRVEDLWKYTTDLKHLTIDPYVRAADVMNRRVESLEKGK